MNENENELHYLKILVEPEELIKAASGTIGRNGYEIPIENIAKAISDFYHAILFRIFFC